MGVLFDGQNSTRRNKLIKKESELTIGDINRPDHA
jgi:ribosome-associated protein YbcJ (S4-like RNA binding protein)